jgi:hypothetical protein
MKRLLVLWLVHIVPLWVFSQNCGLEDTLLINPNATQVFSFEIFDVVNDDLADPNQGVCGVEINFVHQFSENLELWLTAPDGTMVQLIGDNTSDQFAFTFFANWIFRLYLAAQWRCPTLATPRNGIITNPITSSPEANTSVLITRSMGV